MADGGLIAADGESVAVRQNHGDWIVSWHPPPTPPAGKPHGSEGVCVTPTGKIVLVSRDGERWELPAGRPEGTESWEDTLRREMLEEACAIVVQARLLGFTRGTCIAGQHKGAVLVRALWRADVELSPWEPKFEIPHRRLVDAEHVADHLAVSAHPFAPIIRRTLHEAAVPGHQ
ncbi:NUDIX hydrolase [Actinopolymorpha pittospori]